MKEKQKKNLSQFHNPKIAMFFFFFPQKTHINAGMHTSTVSMENDIE